MKNKNNETGSHKLRRFAEKALEEMPYGNGDLSGYSPEDMASLIHELRVHQIELEMQNDELLRIQGELEKTRDMYTNLYDFAPTGYFTMTEKGIIKEANLTIATMLGEPREALIGKSFTHFVLKEDQDILYKHRLHLMDTEAPQVCELRLVKKDGHPIFANLECMITKNNGDDLRDIRTTVSNIAERKEAEEALSESQTILKAALESMTDAVFISDSEGQFIEFNTAFATFHRLKNKSECRKALNDWPDLLDIYLLDNTIVPLDMWAVSRALRGETVTNAEYKLHRKDTGEIWIGSYNFSPICDSDGSIVGSVVVGCDITERKQMESQNLLLADIIRQSSDFIGVADSNQNAIYLNPAGQTMVGLDDDEAVKETKIKDYFFPEDLQFVNQTILPSLMTTGRWIGEFRFKHFKTDKPIHTLYDLFRTSDPVTGNVTNYTTITRDITERKEAEAEREKLQTQLRQAQKMESVGRLAGGVAHDFNNMLSVILGNAELAMENMAPDDPFHNNLNEIFSAARRSADITRQLLAFARKQTIAPKVLDLNRTIKSMLKMLQRLIGEDIDLTWLPEKKVWPVRIDPSQIDQILANLCVNARDAIADVGKITIETGTATFDSAYCVEHPGFVAGDFVLLAVSDNGHGMDSETMSQLFEPFFTTKDVGKGTGLGLATVYGIVKQNDGFINVYSEPDQGTTFRIYLPRYLAETESLDKKTSDKIHMDGTETILLVEDEPSILRMTRMMLERMGYKVLAAGTPGEAIALAREHVGGIHLLMTDVVMPEMNGRDLAKNLLSLYPNLKRLFMSGYTADVIAHHGVLDEGVQFIQKPFSREQLGAKVREALDEDNL